MVRAELSYQWATRCLAFRGCVRQYLISPKRRRIVIERKSEVQQIIERIIRHGTGRALSVSLSATPRYFDPVSIQAFSDLFEMDAHAAQPICRPNPGAES